MSRWLRAVLCPRVSSKTYARLQRVGGGIHCLGSVAPSPSVRLFSKDVGASALRRPLCGFCTGGLVAVGRFWWSVTETGLISVLGGRDLLTFGP